MVKALSTGGGSGRPGKSGFARPSRAPGGGRKTLSKGVLPNQGYPAFPKRPPMKQ